MTTTNPAILPTISSDILSKDTPTRLKDAFARLRFLNEQGIYFAPIRHHSPMCSLALMAAIKDIKPTHILIEAPYSFEGLMDDLLSQDTKPPVAIFAQAKNTQKPQKNTDTAPQATPHSPAIHSAFFPFCEYSPEWVALQLGRDLGSSCHFIDLDWASQSEFFEQLQSLDDLADELHGDTDNVSNDDKDDLGSVTNPTKPPSSLSQKNLMQERYLAHSRYISTLAKRLHCRDHDELWEHLFEVRDYQADGKGFFGAFFDDVFAWCSLARLDYEDSVLYQEGSLHREYCMLTKIIPLINKGNRLMVVTGGFHTLALVENLYNHLNDTPIADYKIHSSYQEDAWLIRYSFDRLNALNGYASGMPSPAYYQYYWRYLLTNSQSDNMTNQDGIHGQFTDYVSALCHTLERRQALDVTPFIALKNTLEIATGLALLRGHHHPSRYDLLDGIVTALIKGDVDDGKTYLWQAVYDYLSGNELGQVAPTQKSPALLQNTYQKAQAFRFKLDDTLPKVRKLDIHRKSLHRYVSQFLHLLYFLKVGFGEFVSGADFVSGTGLDLLFEEWRYAWTPSVEARLIELSLMGDDLKAIAIDELLRQKASLHEAGQLPSAYDTAKLFAKACKMGLNHDMHALERELATYLNQDSNLSSLIWATQQLFYLYQARLLIDVNIDTLLANITLGIRQSSYYLDALYDTTPERIDDNLNNLIALNELIKNITTYTNIHQNDYLTAFYDKLSHDGFLQLGLFSLAGALKTLEYLDGRIDDKSLEQAIVTAFAVGTVPADSVAYLQGIFRVAPEYITGSPIAIYALHELIKSWDGETFLAVLPDLRFVFSMLTPRQSEQIARLIAKKTGVDDSDVLTVDLSISQTDMLYGTRLNQAMLAMLTADGLVTS